MPSPSTISLFQASQSYFYGGGNQCLAGDLNNGTGNIAEGLWYLNKALLAELTQMSQDIAVLKAEVASLKQRPTGLQNNLGLSSHASFVR
jgi:hypothetical protein